MEYVNFPLKYLEVSQKQNANYSHKGIKAIDFVSNNEENKKVYAPFTGKIVKIYNKNNSIWFQSLEKVKFSNGVIDYATVRLVHSNNIKDLYVGKIIKKNSYFYKMGNKGNTTGNHVHIEIARGKQNGYKEKNKYGNYEMPNTINVYDGFFLNQEIKIKDNGGYIWIYDIGNKTKYKIGDKVTYNRIYTSINSTKSLIPKYKTGTITKIYSNAKNPYLINNGIGFINDNCIQKEQIKRVKPSVGLWLLNSKGKRIKAYKKNTKVEILSKCYIKNSLEYYKVKVENKEGYMAIKYLY